MIYDTGNFHHVSLVPVFVKAVNVRSATGTTSSKIVGFYDKECTKPIQPEVAQELFESGRLMRVVRSEMSGTIMLNYYKFDSAMFAIKDGKYQMCYCKHKNGDSTVEVNFVNPEDIVQE